MIPPLYLITPLKPSRAHKAGDYEPPPSWLCITILVAALVCAVGSVTLSLLMLFGVL